MPQYLWRKYRTLHYFLQVEDGEGHDAKMADASEKEAEDVMEPLDEVGFLMTLSYVWKFDTSGNSL